MKRRTSRRRSSRTRPRLDWVYRPNGLAFQDPVGVATGLADALGTYDPSRASLAATATLGFILYDSHNHFSAVQRVAGAGIGPVVGHLSPAARAEGHKASIMATEGVITIVPGTWVLGSTYDIGIRIGVFEQVPWTGGITLDAQYSMWQNLPAGAATTQPADWANDRQWVWERRVQRTFIENTDLNQVRVRIKTKRSLKPYQCWGLLMESAAGSVTVTVQRWLRSLVADEG